MDRSLYRSFPSSLFPKKRFRIFSKIFFLASYHPTRRFYIEAELFFPQDSGRTRKNEGFGGGEEERGARATAGDNGEFNQASPMLLSALLPSAIKSVYLLPVKFHHRARNVLVITSCKPIGKWFSWLGACALHICLGLSEAYPFHSLLGIPSLCLSLCAEAVGRSLETRNRIHRDQCDLPPPFHNRPYSFTDTASPLEGVSCQWPLRLYYVPRVFLLARPDIAA